MHKLLVQGLHTRLRKHFNTFFSQVSFKKKIFNKFQRIFNRKQQQIERKFFGKWRNESVLCQRAALQRLQRYYVGSQEEIFFLKFASQIWKEMSAVFKPDASLDQINELIHLQPAFRTFREFFNSDKFVRMMQKINELLLNSIKNQRYMEKCLDVTDIVYNLQTPSYSAEALSSSHEYAQVCFKITRRLDSKKKDISTHLSFQQDSQD